jgi:hypothetical protein
MNSIELNTSLDLEKKETSKGPYSLIRRFNKFSEAQSSKRLGLFMVSLLAQSVLLLPVPAVLMYYYDAPVSVLAISVLLFFVNLVAGMGGSKTSVLIFLIGLSAIVNLGLILWYVI